MYCFANMVIGLIKTRSVNLVEIACAFAGDAKQESKYKRIIRFFRKFTFDYATVARWMIYQFGLDAQPFYIAMDRTDWKFGKKKINILMLSVVYKGIGIPIMWNLLNKKGTSSTKERIAIITRFIDTFGKKNIAGILADREFIGGAWISWLLKNNIPFCIRIKKASKITNQRGKQVNAWQPFCHLRYGEHLILPMQYNLWGVPVFLSGTRSIKGELVIVVMNRCLQEALQVYSYRWQTETLFAALKSRGFNFEETHLTHIDRLEKLIAVLAIAFCWAHKTGEWRHSIQPIPLKKHGRRLYSYFRYGLDLIQSCLFNNLNHLNIFDFFTTPLALSYQPYHFSYLEVFS